MDFRPTRRRLVLALAAAAMPAPALATGESLAFTDEETHEILQGETLGPAGAAPRDIWPFWADLPAASRPKLAWPSDEAAYDYHHLAAEPNSDQPFTLTPAALEAYFDLCGYKASTAADRVLFGLRGASLADGSDWAGFAPRQAVRETRPDHIHTRCLIGVLDRTRGALALASGSTVPVADLMMAAARGKTRCNMLPTGFHPYRVGPHKGLVQPGAFRQQRALWVHRARGDLTYALSDRGNAWDDDHGALPMDDIHSAMLSYRARPPYFSSAGCQVVTGAYYRGSHQPAGPWSLFREAAGLSLSIHLTGGGNGRTPDDGRAFGYVLLTGKEARLMSIGRTERIPTRRYGASGEDVSRIQAALGQAPATGVFGRKTMGAVLAWQTRTGRAPTGILTPADMAAVAAPALRPAV